MSKSEETFKQSLIRFLNDLGNESKRGFDWSKVGFMTDEEIRFNRFKPTINNLVQPVAIVDPTADPINFSSPGRHNPAGYVRSRLSYAADDVAPHAEVARATQAVAAGERAILLHANASLIKKTAATTVGKVFVTVQEASGASLIYITILTNAVGDSKHDSVGGSIGEYDANTTFVIGTADANTGATPGTIDYRATLNFVRFTE